MDFAVFFGLGGGGEWLRQLRFQALEHGTGVPDRRKLMKAPLRQACTKLCWQMCLHIAPKLSNLHSAQKRC